MLGHSSRSTCGVISDEPEPSPPGAQVSQRLRNSVDGVWPEVDHAVKIEQGGVITRYERTHLPSPSISERISAISSSGLIRRSR